jgi:ABC-type nitrate/sulfonate/bicarbonate transport system permease component
VLIDRAILPEGPSRTAILDEVFGADTYVVTDRVVTGTERVEERKISAALLPSPNEMLDSLPSLLNQRWNTWADARSWWRTGSPEAGTAPAPPLALDWSKWNEVPFALVDALFARTIGPGWKDWKLLHAITWSTLRIVIGFFWAALVAVPLGVVMGSFTKLRVLFEPVRLMGSYLPLPAFLPLTVFWWGMGESQKIGFLGIASFVVLLPQVVMAVEAIPQAHIDAARTLGATRWQLMRRVLLAGAKADIAQSLRLSFAVGWTWIILAEMINPVAGLGWVIQLGERRPAHRPHIYAVVLLIILLAYVVNTVWALIERRLYPYREEA